MFKLHVHFCCFEIIWYKYVYTCKICSTISSPPLEELPDLFTGSAANRNFFLFTGQLVDLLFLTFLYWYYGCRQRKYFHQGFMLLLGISYWKCFYYYDYPLFGKRVELLNSGSTSLKFSVFCPSKCCNAVLLFVCADLGRKPATKEAEVISWCCILTRTK